MVTGRWLLDRKCSEQDAPCHGRLVERRDGVWRGRHFGRLGVLGRMTVCAIIEHRRCRSRPNDQMREGSRGIDKVKYQITTTVIARQSHRSANRPHYSLQQGIPPNEGNTNELSMAYASAPSMSTFMARSTETELRLPSRDPDDPQIKLDQVDLCLEPNQMTPQALHDSTWSMLH